MFGFQPLLPSEQTGLTATIGGLRETHSQAHIHSGTIYLCTRWSPYVCASFGSNLVKVRQNMTCFIAGTKRGPCKPALLTLTKQRKRWSRQFVWYCSIFCCCFVNLNNSLSGTIQDHSLYSSVSQIDKGGEAPPKVFLSPKTWLGSRVLIIFGHMFSEICFVLKSDGLWACSMSDFSSSLFLCLLQLHVPPFRCKSVWSCVPHDAFLPPVGLAAAQPVARHLAPPPPAPRSTPRDVRATFAQILAFRQKWFTRQMHTCVSTHLERP